MEIFAPPNWVYTTLRQCLVPPKGDDVDRESKPALVVDAKRVETHCHQPLKLSKKWGDIPHLVNN